MTSKLFALSFTLLAATAGFADCCPEPDCPAPCPPPCEPCCVPQPKKCIDMEAYLHPWYDMQCNVGMFIDLEFLYWYEREYNLFATKYQTVNVTDDAAAFTAATTTQAAVNEYTLNAKWDPGFRIGLGWEDDCDGFDYGLYWTWYQNHSKNSASVDAFTTNVPSLGGFGLDVANIQANVPSNNLFGGGGGGTFNPIQRTLFEFVSAKYHMLFNRIDFEVGRRYWVSKCFTLRPFVGLRGEWINSSITYRRVNNDFVATGGGSTPVSVPETINLQDKVKRKPWMVGFYTGFQPAFFFTREFSLFGNLDAALGWGKQKQTSTSNYLVTNVTDGTLLVNLTNSDHINFSSMWLDIDVAIGLRWEDSWCDDMYRFALDAGWEHHFASQIGQVVMGGFVLRARFDF